MNSNGSLRIIAGACLFGLIPVFVRFAGELSLFSIAFGRALFAALFAKGYLFFQKEKTDTNLFRFRSATLFHFMVWTLFLTLAILFYFLSIRYGSVSLSGVLLGVHPVFVVLFVFLFFRENITLSTWISCGVALLGIFLLSGITGKGIDGSVAGSLYALASAFFLGLNFTYYLKYLNAYSAGELVYYQNVFQLPLLLPFVIYQPGTLSFDGIIAVVCLGVFCTGMAYFLIYSGSQTVSKQHIGVLQIIENIIPVVLGIVFFHEQMQFISYVGIALVLLAVVMIGLEEKTG